MFFTNVCSQLCREMVRYEMTIDDTPRLARCTMGVFCMRLRAYLRLANGQINADSRRTRRVLGHWNRCRVV